MNFLTFVFSLLLIFSIGTFVSLEKQSGNRRIRSTYLGHISANRKLLCKCENETYKELKSVPQITIPKINPSKKAFKQPTPPKINPQCARLNLWPLVQEGKEEHPFLYEIALKMVGYFYEKPLFEDKPQAKIFFLNAFLKKAKEEIEKNEFCLEKLSLDHSLQMTYYKMLKGTKQWDCQEKIGYPSILDILIIEPQGSKICLSHAHPGQLRALFGDKAGIHLYEEIHQETPIIITKELIEETCARYHMISLNPEIFHLIDLEKTTHPQPKKTTLIAEDKASQISLKKQIYRS
jgi:hypothetical protein